MTKTRRTAPASCFLRERVFFPKTFFSHFMASVKSHAHTSRTTYNMHKMTFLSLDRLLKMSHTTPTPTPDFAVKDKKGSNHYELVKSLFLK